MVALFVGGGGPTAAPSAPDDGRGDRTVAFLPLDDPFEADVDDGEALEAEPVLPPSDGAGDALALPGGAAGEAAGTADVDAEPGGEGAGSGAGDGEGAGNGHAEPARRRVASKHRKKRCDTDNPHIKPGRDGVVEIDRSLVDAYTKNLESFMSLGYSRPQDNGEVKGWYIGGFGCNSPVHEAGFRRGDVLLTVNGKRTRNWVGVFLLYQKLKNKDEFEIELLRRGEPMTLRFRVVRG
ncbi:MAG: hypothetical protein R3F59_05590 [Myxococcota bacterium]